MKAPLEAEIRQTCNEIADMLVEKNAAYGNSVGDPLNVFSTELSPLQKMDVRIDDKLSRLARGTEYPGDDTIMDLTGYLILRMVIARAG